MSRREKLLEKVRNNPRAVTYEELARVLEWHGFQLRRSRGSHHLFKRGRRQITVVYRRPHVHPAAVKEALALIDEIEEGVE